MATRSDRSRSDTTTCATATTISLPAFLEYTRQPKPFRICWKCRQVTQPLSDAETHESGVKEKRCGAHGCGAAAAVELRQAASEGWLQVIADGHDVTDRVLA